LNVEEEKTKAQHEEEASIAEKGKKEQPTKSYT